MGMRRSDKTFAFKGFVNGFPFLIENKLHKVRATVSESHLQNIVIHLTPPPVNLSM